MTHMAHNTYQASLGYPRPGTYRRTPAGQPRVPDLVRCGMAVRTDYGTGGIVVAVKGPFVDRLDGQDYETWSVLYVAPQHYGQHGAVPEHWFDNPKICAVNELVAVDGRILALFGNNGHELLIEDARPLTPVDKHGQMGLLL